jgi:hypothetical protein
MSFSPRQSRRVWLRKLNWRERRLAVAHRRKRSAAIAHWTPLVKEAQRMVDLRTKQSRPLRLRAWDVMQTLIDEKVTEQGGNNRGAEVEKIIRANGGVPGEAWCGDTVAYTYLKAGSKMVTRSWAAVRLLLAGGSTRYPKRGHIVRYDFSPVGLDHTGEFCKWAPDQGPGFFWAGEGNTGDTGAQSDSRTGGDGVKLKLRHISQVHDFRVVTR